jgi:hypothetical protein
MPRDSRASAARGKAANRSVASVKR